MANLLNAIYKVIKSSSKVIEDILAQTKGIKFDYIIYSAPFPFGDIMTQILKIPAISSLAVFLGIKEFLDQSTESEHDDLIGNDEIMDTYKKVSENLYKTYSVKMPSKIMNLFFNTGDINIVYTSQYFISKSDFEYFDDSFKFVGPPIYDRKENSEFPFEKLEGKKVIYISLGTVFGSYNLELYKIFFRSFADLDAVIVMAAYNVDLSQFEIPNNFIVKNYVPQSEILKHTDAAITHGGMNSISDLIYNSIPFVTIPLGADQPALAKKSEELGAAISLDANKLNPETLKASIEIVLNDPSYIKNIKKISNSFKEAGGYKKAVEEIAKFKKEKGIYEFNNFASK